MLPKMMVSSHHHCGDPKKQGATIEVMDGGGEEIPLSVVRPCGMRAPSNGALDMNGSPHLTLSYLLRSEHDGLGI